MLTSASSGLYRNNRKRLVSYFNSSGAIYLKGNGGQIRNADIEVLFRQDSDFLYVSGVVYPECQFLIDIASGQSLLFVPDRTEYDVDLKLEIDTKIN